MTTVVEHYFRVYKIRQTFALKCLGLKEMLRYLKWRIEKATKLTKFAFWILEVKNQFNYLPKNNFFRVCTIGYIGEGLLLLIFFDNF
jgi:hypothetical protein